MTTKNVVVEIRAGAGGDEASLFAGELYRMYSRLAENNRWKVDIVTESPSEVGGFKEIIFEIHGSEVYAGMKFESGVHRVSESTCYRVTGACSYIHGNCSGNARS